MVAHRGVVRGGFYINRMLRVTEGALYSSVAAGLIAMVLGYETPHQYLSVAWLAFAAILFEAGFRLRQTEFRYQSYVVGALGTGAGILLDMFEPFAWLPLAICAALLYAGTLRMALSNDDGPLSEAEKKLSWITAASTAAFLFAIVWKVAPGNYLGAAWLLLGAVLFELGLRKLPKHFRWLSYLVSAAGFLNMLFHPFEAGPVAVAMVACWSMSARIFRPMPDRIGDREREWCRDLYAAAGTLFAMTLVWLKLPPAVVALVWTVLGLALFEIGLRFALPRFRLLAHLIAAAVCFRIFMIRLRRSRRLSMMHFKSPTAPSRSCRSSRRITTSGGAISARPARLYLYVSAALFLALARFELGWPLAVVAWALFGLALYAVGRLRNIADLQWQSHAIALLSFFSTVEALAGNQTRALPRCVVIASLYCAQLLAPATRKASSAMLALFIRSSPRYCSPSCSSTKSRAKR